MDPSLRLWLWIIEYLVSNRDMPFSILGGIIDNIPYTLDDFPSHIREGLALRCHEELAAMACGETPAAVAYKATSTLVSSGNIDASQTRAKVMLSKMMQKNSESSQPNVSYSKECNNLPEVSRPCVKHFTYSSHRDDHDKEKFIPTKKYASPQTKDLNLIRKFRDLKNLANTPYKSVGGASQNDFNILPNMAEQNSLDDIQNHKTAVDGTCNEFQMENTEINPEEVSAEFHDVEIHLSKGNLSGLASPIIISDNIKESQSGQDSQNHNVLLHDRHELQADNDIQYVKASSCRITVDNNGTCEVSKNHLQAEERKNLLTSDADNELISLQLNKISVLNIEVGCDHSAKRKALSSKISVRFAKRNRREKADIDDNYHGSIENKRTDRFSLKGLRKRRNRQTLWTAIKRPSRRPKLIWKPEEEEVLEKAMQKIPQNDDGTTSWIKILEYCHPVLHESRTPIDLKDKWRNMQIREAKNRG